MAKGYSARNGFGGSAGMMRQQQQMQQKMWRSRFLRSVRVHRE